MGSPIGAKLRAYSRSTIVVLVLAAAATVAVASPAAASADSCKPVATLLSHEWGQTFYDCYAIRGSGSYVKSMKGYAYPDPGFPNFTGCHTHVEFWEASNPRNSYTSTDKPCSEFIAGGYQGSVTFNRNVDPGSWCERIWTINRSDTNWQGGAIACETIS